MNEDEEQMDPVFRRRLRMTLGRYVREEPRRPAVGRIARGVVAVLGLMVAGGVVTMMLVPRNPVQVASADTLRVEAVCAVDALPAGEVDGHGVPGIEVAPFRGVPISVTATDADAVPERAREACAELWRTGVIRASDVSLSIEFHADTGSGFPEPTLVARRVPQLGICALPGGTLVVIPDSDCAAFGLEEFLGERAH